MDFKCFICEKLFANQKDCVNHLKKGHFVKENKDPIYCLKNNPCKRYFLNYRALNIHSKQCTFDVEPQVKYKLMEKRRAKF